MASLQYIRAIAAWMVVFHHYLQIVHHFNASSHIGRFFSHHGSFGVDLFFVLSGVVMVLTVNRDVSISPLIFIWRRIRRLAPAYWIATLFLMALIPWIGEGALPFVTVAPGNVASSLLFVPLPNVFAAGSYPVLTVGWTLNFEMAFYVLIGSVLFCRKWSVECWVFAAMALCSAMPRISGMTGPWASVFGSQMFYAFPIGLALGLGIRAMSCGNAANHQTALGCLSLVVAIAVAWAGQGPWHEIPLGFHLRYGRFVLAACIVFSAACFDQTLAGPFRCAVLLRLGDVSYSTYLYHVPAIAIVYKLVGTPTSLPSELLLLSGATVLTLVLSELSYRTIERPGGRTAHHLNPYTFQKAIGRAAVASPAE